MKLPSSKSRFKSWARSEFDEDKKNKKNELGKWIEYRFFADPVHFFPRLIYTVAVSGSKKRLVFLPSLHSQVSCAKKLSSSHWIFNSVKPFRWLQHMHMNCIIMLNRKLSSEINVLLHFTTLGVDDVIIRFFLLHN